jgi:hypothetical protein
MGIPTPTWLGAPSGTTTMSHLQSIWDLQGALHYYRAMHGEEKQIWTQI